MEGIKRMTKKSKLEIVTHFLEDDKDYGSDYIDVEVLVDGKVVRKYDDEYHGQGKSRAEGFVDGVKFIQGGTIKERNVADREY